MNRLESQRKRVFHIIQIGYDDDLPSRAFDFVSIIVILINLVIAIIETFEGHEVYRAYLDAAELLTVLFFTGEYALRIWTADYLYPSFSRQKARLKYGFSFSGAVDLLSFLPYYLPFFFPMGIVAFRMFRVIRIFRLFRINAYYDALNVIIDVLKSKKDQLLSSIFIIFILMIGSSLCMYSLEHEAQPEVFKNAFSGFWWAAATLLTVGYGDIYPITAAGRALGIVITFLGVGMVAIPTGILSAGFVEQYTKLKDFERGTIVENLDFIRMSIDVRHPYKGKAVSTLTMPEGLFLTGIQRKNGILIPKPATILEQGDRLIICAKTPPEDKGPVLKLITLKKAHPWCGMKLSDLDISRQTLVLAVLRGDDHLVPDGNMVLANGDRVLLYTKKVLSDAESIQI